MCRRTFRATAALLAGGSVLAACGGAAASSAPSPPAPSLGTSFDRAVPAHIAGIPLVDQHGHTTDLAAFRGRVLVLAQFLTSCQEVCPLTTGAFITIQHDLNAAGLSGKVALAELTVDPGRDTAARLAAYQALTGATWTLLTASPAALAPVWRFFGVYYQKVPVESSPGTDWQTGQRYTYDVNHTNGFIVFDPSGNERFQTINLPNLHGGLATPLRKLLDDQGIANLVHPVANQSWTIVQALRAIGSVLGRHIPTAP